MTKFRLLIISLLALAVLTGADQGIEYLARREPARLKIASIENAPSDSTCIAIGNSLMDSGFNADAFDLRVQSGFCKGLNAALGATTPAEHDVMLHAALDRIPRPKIVYYGWYDQQLTLPPRVGANDLIGNRNVGLLLDPVREIALTDMDWRTWILNKLLGRFALYVDRGQAWGKIELLRRWLHDFGLPAAEGPPPDPFRALEANSVPEFEALLEKDLRDQAPLSRPVVDLLGLIQQSGAQGVFVVMPMPEAHRSRFYGSPVWRRYLAYVGGLIAAGGGRLCDASDWIGDPALFADSLHLNPAGAVEFSRRLAAATTGNDVRRGGAPSCSGLQSILR